MENFTPRLVWCVLRPFFLAAVSSFAFSSFAIAESVDVLSGTSRLFHKFEPEHSHWYSNPTLIGGLKSQNNLGRLPQTAQSVRSRNEIFIGTVSAAGWGTYVMGAYVASSSNRSSLSGASPRMMATQKKMRTQTDLPSPADSGGLGASPMNRNGFQDIQLALLHPLFDYGIWSFSGQYKQTFPVSEMSQSNHNWGEAYYLVAVARLPQKYRLSDTASFHYHSRDNYDPPFDSTWTVGEILTLTKHLNNWFKWGTGSRLQADIHQTAPMGTALEIFLIADFMINRRLFLGPRIHFPVAAQNSVFSEVPTTPSTSNIQAEIYLQSTL